MYRSFKFLLRPTRRQQTALAACLEDHRALYNAALTERREAYRMRTVSIRYTRSASGTLDSPGTRVAQKTGLNRSILNAGWGLFLRILTHKAESAGRELIAVNPAGTSRTCAACGHCTAGNRVSQAEFRCQACDYAAHADVNAARNILRAGLALRVAGAA